jgi:hypothetical protein
LDHYKHFGVFHYGEKLWLTVHIALPMILLSGLSIGYWSTRQIGLISKKNVVGWFSAGACVYRQPGGSAGLIVGTDPTFFWENIEQLSATSTFLLSLGQ